MESTAHSFAANEQILSPFTKQRCVFFLRSGYVTAATTDDDGKHRIHLIYGPGSYFPILSVFRGTPQRATYVALTHVEVDRLDIDSFKSKLQADVGFSNDILAKTIDQLALFADRIIDLQLTKLDEQMLYKLKTLADSHGVRVSGGLKLPYQLKHHHIADMLGVERESASRALNRLIKRGAIQLTEDKKLVITITE